MGVEIERKFLAQNDGWRALAEPSRATVIHQGFLSRDPERVVRVRVETPLQGGEVKATLTVKGMGAGASRPEFEYPIPTADAAQLLELCMPEPVHKVRWRIDAGGGRTFEIDEFRAPHAGLVVVELELASPEQTFVRPAWLGREVTGDPRYANSALSAPGAPTPPGSAPAAR